MNHRAVYVLVLLLALLGGGLMVHTLQSGAGAEASGEIRKRRAKGKRGKKKLSATKKKGKKKGKKKRKKKGKGNKRVNKRVTGDGPGRWIGVGSPDDEFIDPDAMLDAIGYVDGSVPVSGKTGVTFYDPKHASDGYNFYASGHGGAVLTDMDGTVKHTWAKTHKEAYPGNPKARNKGYWRRALLLPNGDVIAIFEGRGLIRIDKNSELVWASPLRAHHDLQLMPDGTLWVLTREAIKRPDIGPRFIAEDFVVALDAASGELKEKHSVLAAIEASPFAEDLKWKRKSGDLVHTNSLKVLDGSVAHMHRAFKKGRILTSSRNLDALMLIDLKTDQVVWVHRGSFKRQHDPRILDNGHLLVFDNNGPKGKHSRILEYDLSNMSVVWAFQGNEEVPFHTPTCGAAHRLPNQNTLITESDAGRAIEINAEGEIVWEFRNPHRAGNEQQYIAAIFEMVRLPRKQVDRWLSP